MSSDCTNIAKFSIFIFTDFKPCFEASTVKAMRPNLTRKFSFQLILEFSSQYWKYDVPIRCSRLFSFHVHHGVEVDILEDQRFKGMFSARLSSRNCGSNSVLFGDLFLYVNGLFLGRIDIGLPLPPLLLFEDWDLPASWRHRFPDARLKIQSSF